MSDSPFSNHDEARRRFTAEQIAGVFELEPWQRRLLAAIESGPLPGIEAVAVAERRNFKRRLYESTNAMYRALGFRVEEHGRYAVIWPPADDPPLPD